MSGGSQYEAKGNLGSPLLHTALKRSQLSIREQAGHACLQTLKQFLRCGGWLIRKPFLDQSPNRFERIRSSAPSRPL